ncbi:riboflavin synthase [Anaerovorax odorimutans]|uniref:riboflavin synthase n=1 Tax=Anaerovorax odorimutans TaxID=109327 RepID=UPI00040F8829|nr:riboflavin synthase [Anaerovorax odorimutans]
MFTGIVEEVGKVGAVQNGRQSSKLTIVGNKIFEDMRMGDSISVNGVCLTVTNFQGNSFNADVMAETLRRSNLGNLKQGSEVNLERAMSVNGRFGGHIVSGHIDGTGMITSLNREDNAVWIYIKTSKDLLRYIILKGSIAIDGISLTVAHVDTDSFGVSVIPHTGSETTLLRKKVNDIVNLECDVIGKYVEKLIRPIEKNNNENTSNFSKNINGFNSQESNISMDFLSKHGF